MTTAFQHRQCMPLREHFSVPDTKKPCGGLRMLKQWVQSEVWQWSSTQLVWKRPLLNGFAPPFSSEQLVVKFDDSTSCCATASYKITALLNLKKENKTRTKSKEMISMQTLIIQLTVCWSEWRPYHFTAQNAQSHQHSPHQICPLTRAWRSSMPSSATLASVLADEAPICQKEALGRIRGFVV